MAEFGSHWETKMKNFFHRVDTDNDGVLTENDFKLMADNLIKAGQLSGTRADQIRNMYLELWNKYFKPVTGKDAATSEEFISNVKQHGKEAFRSITTEIMTMEFDIVDTNQDGRIQMGEFVNYFNIYGISESFAKKAFTSLDADHNGVLSRQEFVTAGVNYFTLEVPNYPADLFYG